MKLWQLFTILGATYIAAHTPAAWAAVFAIFWLVMATVAAWKRV